METEIKDVLHEKSTLEAEINRVFDRDIWPKIIDFQKEHHCTLNINIRYTTVETFCGVVSTAKITMSIE